MDLELLIELTARLDLPSDNHPQCFDEEVSGWISNNCPDWKNPKESKTYMIPPTFPDIRPDDKGESTEKHVFDMLEKFGRKSKPEQPMFVVHSHKFHELFQNLEKGSVKNDFYWCRGETDFVIIHRTLGVIFLQVKAAEKTARAHRLAEEQLEKDQKSLNGILRRLSIKKEEKKMERLGLSEPERKKKLNELGMKIQNELHKYRGFVVMPNCPRDKAGGRIGCFREDIDSMEHFEKWWQDNMQRSGEFSPDMYELMAIWFVGPRVFKESSLLKHVDEDHKWLVKLTVGQLKIMTGDVPKQNIAGPAGSGKTWLLLEKAKQVAGKLRGNERILIMCFNKPLSLYLESEFKEFPMVVIKTFVSMLREIKGEKLDVQSEDKEKEVVLDCVQKLNWMQANSDPTYKYEHVFVDEGQDMYGTWMDLVNLLHADSDEERRYRWVFFDNNQSVHFGSKYSIPTKIINNAKLMIKIVRNTANIFQCSQWFLSPSVDAELAHGIVGLPVRWLDSLPSCAQWLSEDQYTKYLQEGVELVRQEIADLDSESVLRSDIVVLTSNLNKSVAVLKIFANTFYIPAQDAEDAIRYPDKSCITVDSIRRFKGLERKVVILFDPPLDEEESMELNYVAMSRCFCLLVIVTTREKRQKYEEFTQKLKEGKFA